MLVTLRVVALGYVTGGFLRRLLSCFVHPFSHRREFNALFHRAHKFRASIDDDRMSKLPADIKDELVYAAFSLPLSHSHLRWPVDTRISCSDATPDKIASVSARVSVPLAENLYDVTIMKGKCCFQFHLGRSARGRRVFPNDPFSDSIVERIPWEVSSQTSFISSQHVNLRELAAALEVPRQAASLSLFPVRKVNGSDSTVAIRGRSERTITFLPA